jgi:hypothetical protein
MPIDAWRGSDYLFRIGGSYALAGLLDEAFSILESIRYDQSYDSVVRLELDPSMNGLRDDPRFQKLLTTARAQVDAASTR